MNLGVEISTLFFIKEIIKVNIGEAQLAVELSGKGNSIIFLHAGVADRRMWGGQVEELSNDFHIITYDRRGFGETKSPDIYFSHVVDLGEVLGRIRVPKVSLIGCSHGARIAIDFALANPKRVDALVLISPSISGNPAPDIAELPAELQARLSALDEAEEANNVDQINSIQANLWLDGPLSTEGRVGGSSRELFLEMNRIALEKPNLSREIEPPAAYERLAELSVPVLVVWGALDFLHIKERCGYLIEAIPNAKGEELANTAHMLNLEKPKVINKLLRSFLT